jgi:hypothetical protein
MSETPTPRWWSVVGSGAWTGVLAGTIAGPVLGIVAYLVSALASGRPDAGLDEDGEWSGLVFFVFFLPFIVVVLAFLGEAIGALVGAITAATVLVAIRVEARLGFRGGTALLAIAGLAGGVVSVAIALPVLAIVYPAALYWVRDVWTVTVVVAAVAAIVTVARRKSIEPVRLALAAAEIGAARPSVARARVLGVWGFAALVLVIVATVEMAVLIPSFGVGPSCFSGESPYYIGWVGAENSQWPPQVTCIYDTATVELVPRWIYVVLALTAIVAAGLLAAAAWFVVRAARNQSDGSSFRMRTARRVALPVVAALVALLLAGYSTVGVVRPMATVTPEESAGWLDIEPPPSPALPSVVPAVPSATPAPVTPVPAATMAPPTSTYSIDELTILLQELVDATFAAAGPIDDPAIPVETQTFAVVVGECMEGGVPGRTAYLSVGFDTGDVAQSLERVRALWTSEGYALYERSVNARGDILTPGTSVSATGADPQVATSLFLRISADYLILDIAGLCVSE